MLARRLALNLERAGRHSFRRRAPAPSLARHENLCYDASRSELQTACLVCDDAPGSRLWVKVGMSHFCFCIRVFRKHTVLGKLLPTAGELGEVWEYTTEYVESVDCGHQPGCHR